MTDAVADLRRDARKIFFAAVQAAEPGPLVHAALLNAPELHSPKRIVIIAAGKAAPAMAAAARETLGHRVASCLVAAPRENMEAVGAALTSPEVRCINAGHPLPDEASVTAGRTALHLAGHSDDDTALVVLLSGGASAILAVPHTGISLADYRDITLLLQNAGATIDELNCVRKHIDQIKGGCLARAAKTATILGLVISDVVANRLDVIASGPLSPDTTTAADALDVLRRYGLEQTAPASVLHRLRSGARGDHSDTPKPGDPAFDRVRLQVIADSAHALEAATSYARRLGYDAARLAEPVVGSARNAGALLGSQLRNDPDIPGAACMIAGGETTVTVRGNGTGGRNQELALAAAIELHGSTSRVLLSGGTDGIDGPTTAAGAVVDGGSVARMRDRGIDPAAALADNDSHAALAGADDLLTTGPTGTNVMDVQIMLRRSPPR